MPDSPVPGEVRFELTHRCNLDCVFCFNKNIDVEQELPTEGCLRIIDNIADSGVKNVRITGGEPFARRDLKEIMFYAKQRGLYVILNTNATMITERNYHALVYADLVLISIHGLEGNELTFKMRGLELARRLGVPVMTCTILTQENISRLEEFYMLMDALRVKDWFLLRTVPYRASPSPTESEWVAELVEKVIALNRKYSREARIANSLPFCSYEPEKVSGIALGGRYDNGYNDLVVNQDGSIRTDYFDDKVLGNALRDSITDVWNGEYMRARRALKDLPRTCRKCNYSATCLGGLRFAAKMAGSGMDPLAHPERYSEKLFNPDRREKPKLVANLVARGT